MIQLSEKNIFQVNINGKVEFKVLYVNNDGFDVSK